MASSGCKTRLDLERGRRSISLADFVLARTHIQPIWGRLRPRPAGFSLAGYPPDVWGGALLVGLGPTAPSVPVNSDSRGLAVRSRRGGRGIWGDRRTDQATVLVELLDGECVRVGTAVGDKPPPRVGCFLARREVA